MDIEDQPGSSSHDQYEDNFDVDEDISDSEDQFEVTEKRSTKRPLKKQSMAGKEKLLQSAISFLDNRSKKTKVDEDVEEKFGKYVASELKDIEDIGSRQMAKLEIQQILTMRRIGMGNHSSISMVPFPTNPAKQFQQSPSYMSPPSTPFPANFSTPK